MRSTIAKRMNTHALDDRLVTLLPEQLMTLFMDAKEQETEDIKRVADWVKLINDAWVQNFSNLFEDLKVFVNPELFQKIQEHKAMDVRRL